VTRDVVTFLSLSSHSVSAVPRSPRYRNLHWKHVRELNFMNLLTVSKVHPICRLSVRLFSVIWRLLHSSAAPFQGNSGCATLETIHHAIIFAEGCVMLAIAPGSVHRPSDECQGNSYPRAPCRLSVGISYSKRVKLGHDAPLNQTWQSPRGIQSNMPVIFHTTTARLICRCKH
jgi:hypothetical protein